MTIKHRAAKAALLSFCLLFFLLFLSSGTICTWLFVNEKQTKSLYQNLAEQFQKTTQDQAKSNGIVPFTVDLASMKAQNPDIVAWLYIPCLKISYPLMYSGDNECYLYRDFHKSYAMEGSLFLDAFSSPDFSGGNTVIYGHNMADGSMFGHLWHIPFQDAAKEDPYFWIFTEEHSYRYKIFSAFEATLYADAFKQFEAATPEFLSWCQERQEESYIRTGQKQFLTNDHVVTLSTCAADSYNRTFVLGYRESEYPHEPDPVCIKIFSEK